MFSLIINLLRDTNVISLFKHGTVSNRRRNAFARMDYIRDRFSDNLTKAINFYQFGRRAVRSNHILVTLINSILAPHSSDLERFIELVHAAAPSVGHGLGIGSPIYKAAVFKDGPFYGKGTDEVLFFVESDYDRLPHWTQVKAITVLCHPKTDISFNLLDGIPNTDESGYAVIAIDPVLLMYQYRQWRKTQINAPAGEALSVNHFVAMYVLPSMLESHLDVAWLNRILAQLTLRPTHEGKRRLSFALPTHTTYVEQTQSEIIDKLTRNNMSYEDMLANIPTIFSGTMIGKTELAKMAPTKQTNMFYLLSSLPWIWLLASADAATDATSNGKYHNEINRAISRLNSERWLDALTSDKKRVELLVNVALKDEILPLLV